MSGYAFRSQRVSEGLFYTIIGVAVAVTMATGAALLLFVLGPP